MTPEFVAYDVKGEELSRDYLRHPLAWSGFLEWVRAGSAGTNVRRRRLQPAAFEAIQIPLPSRPDQDRIAAHLSSLDDRVAGLDSSAPHLMEQLPRLLGKLLTTAVDGVTVVQSLCANRQLVIHPGDDLRGAEEFVGLEHIESHTGRRIGGRPIGDESGRKLLRAGPSHVRLLASLFEQGVGRRSKGSLLG